MMYKQTILLTVLLLVGFTPMAKADTLFPFPGPNDPLSWNQGIRSADVGVHKFPDEMWTESWYFMTRFGDGNYLFNHFVISNAGWGSFNGAVESTILYPDGRSLFEKEKIDGNLVVYAEGKSEVKFGDKHYLKGDANHFEIVVRGEKVQYSFTVQNRAPALRPGAGKTFFGEDKATFYDLTILSPNGSVHGTLTVEGKPFVLNGTAYGDHAYQTHPAHKMADRLFSMRGFTEANAADLLVFVPPSAYGDNARIASLVIAEGDKVTFSARNLISEEVGLSADPEMKNYKLPTEIRLVNAADEPPFTGKIKLIKQIQRQDAVQDFNFLERSLIKMFVAKPILYRYSASYEFQYPGQNTGETRTIAGEAMVEYMILRDKR